LSIALDKRSALLSSALDRRTAISPSALDRRIGCRVHSTKARSLAERTRQTSSALDRRTALLWSAIENQSVLSSSPLDNRIVTKSALSCQHPTMLCIPIQRCPHITVPYMRNMLELPPTPFEYTSHVLGSRRECTQGHLVPLSTPKKSPWPTQRSPVSG